ncbi:protein phosphatase EYA [Typha angustifolia]|uniref:protein phosphatase EYA n=1 Tax=Typha angustifolia TaxID=59011 RepID=UPI003C2F8292
MNDNCTAPCQNRQDSMIAVEDHPMTVYIWDMDETLILLKSLLDGTYAGVFHGLKDFKTGLEIGKRWENLILQVCDEHFFYEEIENYNEPFLSSLSEYDDGRDLSDYDFKNDVFSSPYDDPNKRKLAYRHRSIAEKYAQGLHNILDEKMIKIWDELYSLTDSYTDRWLSSGHALLEKALGRNMVSNPDVVSSELAPVSIKTERQSINVLVTSGSLIPSLVKCLLYRLDDVISHDNVYSSWEVGKLQCFNWIKKRFTGPNVQFCVIGDGLEECAAAEAMRWPLVKIDMRPNGPHRFPGLTLGTIQSYIDVIYGPPDADAKRGCGVN